MFFLRIYSFSRLNYLLSLILLLSLVSCSGGDGDSTSNPNPTSVIDVINVLGLNWTAPSQREDGSALALSEIAGYRIYYGTEAGDYQNQIDIDDSTAEQAQVIDLPSGAYYVVLTTVDTEGRESLYSPEVVVNL